MLKQEKKITPQNRPAACKVKSMMNHRLPHIIQRTICMIGLWLLSCKRENWDWEKWQIIRGDKIQTQVFQASESQCSSFPLTHIYLTADAFLNSFNFPLESY